MSKIENVINEILENNKVRSISINSDEVTVFFYTKEDHTHVMIETNLLDALRDVLTKVKTQEHIEEHRQALKKNVEAHEELKRLIDKQSKKKMKFSKKDKDALTKKVLKSILEDR